MIGLLGAADLVVGRGVDRELEPNGAGALVVVLLLSVVVFFLVRSMTKHLRRVPPSFDRTPPGPGATRPEDDPPGDA